MMGELIAIAAVMVGGIAFARSAGFDDWALPGVGFLCGLCLQIIITSLLLMLGLSTHAYLVLMLTALLPITWWISCGRRGQDIRVPVRTIATTAIVALAVVGVTQKLHLVKLSPDSFNYLNTAALIANDNMQHAAPNWLQLRVLGVPSIHAPANLSGAYYLRSVTPLLALSTLVLLSLICVKWCQSTMGAGRLATAMAVATAVLLASHHRFAYHAFYINGHILVAACLLVLAGGNWLLASKANVDARAIWSLQVICIPALVVTRPDGALFAGVCMLPMLVSDRFCWRHRASLLGTLGISIVAWHGFLWMRYAAAGQPIPVTVSGMLGLGIVSLLVIPALNIRFAAPSLRHLLIAVEGTLWLALIAFAIRDMESFRLSVRATFHNVILDAGGWGISLKLLCMVVAVTLLLTRVQDRVYLRFPVTTFIPLCLVLGFLRQVPYRVGAGDSLNRMFLHVVPIAILLIVSSVKADRLALLGSSPKLRLPDDDSMGAPGEVAKV